MKGQNEKRLSTLTRGRGRDLLSDNRSHLLSGLMVKVAGTQHVPRNNFYVEHETLEAFL